MELIDNVNGSGTGYSKRLRQRHKKNKNRLCYYWKIVTVMAAWILSLAVTRRHLPAAIAASFVTKNTKRHFCCHPALLARTKESIQFAPSSMDRFAVNHGNSKTQQHNRRITTFTKSRHDWRIRLFSTTTSSQDEKDNTSITAEDVYQELQWLSREIRRHDALYYNTQDNDDDKDSTIRDMITDDDYDALVRREEEICRNYPDLQAKWEKESEWGKEATRVGGRVGIGIGIHDNSKSDGTADNVAASTTTAPRFQKRNHLVPMLSLDNVTDKAQLDAWLERLFKKLVASQLSDRGDGDNESTPASSSSRITILTEPKLDGLSLSLRYKLMDNDSDRGGSHTYELVWACTRGDGKKGQDVTQPVTEGLKLPTTLKVTGMDHPQTRLPDILEIRGEVVLPRSTFQKFKEQAAQEEAATKQEDYETTSATNNLRRFSNARNAASGILLRKAAEVKNEKNNEELSNQTTATTGTTTLQLQAMLQFYAYDMVVNKHDGEVEWLEDALAARQQLQDWGFSVANPVAVTTLDLNEVKNDTTSANNDNESEHTVEVEQVDFESWTDQDIQPMLAYHEALGVYREELQQQQQEATTNQPKKTSKKPSKKEPFVFGDYDMDGCVHKVSQLSLRRLVGNSNRAPRWAVAHKFPSQSAITSLLDIEVQVGRKLGALTPVAILEPVELGGVTVTRATLHNFQHMQQLLSGESATETTENNAEESLTSSSDEATPEERQRPMFLGKGSKVLVRRAGDVIPQVVQLAEPPKRATKQGTSSSWIDLSDPPQCPACGSPTVVDVTAGKSTSSESGRGQILRCSGPPLLCPPRAIGALVHAYSRDALDVSGLSEKKIQQLSTVNNTVEEDNKNETDVLVNPEMIKLRYPSDVFKLAKDPAALEAIASLPGWGPKSAQKLANTANKVATDGVSLSRFINSLAIRFAGRRSSKLIATAYGTVDAFLGAVEHASQWEAADFDSEQDSPDDNRPRPFELLADKDNEVNKGIGPSLLSSLVAFSQQQELVQAAKELALLVNVQDDEDYQRAKAGGSSDEDNEQNQTNKPFHGLKVVFTGNLASIRLTRKAAQELAMSMGAESTPGTISKATDIVIVGEKAGEKKLEAARNLGVTLMELDEFMELVKVFQS